MSSEQHSRSGIDSRRRAGLGRWLDGRQHGRGSGRRRPRGDGPAGGKGRALDMADLLRKLRLVRCGGGLRGAQLLLPGGQGALQLTHPVGLVVLLLQLPGGAVARAGGAARQMREREGGAGQEDGERHQPPGERAHADHGLSPSQDEGCGSRSVSACVVSTRSTALPSASVKASSA